MLSIMLSISGNFAHPKESVMIVWFVPINQFLMLWSFFFFFEGNVMEFNVRLLIKETALL